MEEGVDVSCSPFRFASPNDDQVFYRDLRHGMRSRRKKLVVAEKQIWHLTNGSLSASGSGCITAKRIGTSGASARKYGPANNANHIRTIQLEHTVSFSRLSRPPSLAHWLGQLWGVARQASEERRQTERLAGCLEPKAN
ncbi:MAG: hypothetical protein ACI9MC_002047 [Kiritimatiellia bacterium]